MKIYKLRNTFAIFILALTTLFAINGATFGQNKGNNDGRRKTEDRREAERRERRQRRELDRLRRESEYRMQEVQDQQARDVAAIDQFREEQRIKNQGNRYRIFPDGKEFQTDWDGTIAIRDGMMEGYQQGYLSGKTDHREKYPSEFATSPIYEDGKDGYKGGIDENVYQYYFRKAFERGYSDGFNGKNQYGKSSNGIRLMSDPAIQEILKLEQI